MRGLLVAAALLAALSPLAGAAPMPRLEAGPPVICKPAATHGAGAWLPDDASVRALEAALPPFFKTLRNDDPGLPAPIVFARQYQGVVRDGKRYVYATFYPADHPVRKFLGSGGCRAFFDGGNEFWTVWFDIKARRVVSMSINGIA